MGFPLFMVRFHPSFLWITLLVCVGVGMDAYSSHALLSLSSVGDVHRLALPVRVEMLGEVMNLRSSGPAAVFDLVNEGRITCYHRHPSRVVPLFVHDWVRVRARVESTPKGRLCVVEEVFLHVPH